MDSERIIHMRFKPTDKHVLDDAKQIVAAHNDLANGVACSVLADIREVKVEADRAARKYYVSDESARYKAGMAMLVNSPMQRMPSNTFFFINRPHYPTRMFTDSEDCMTWLKNLNG